MKVPFFITLFAILTHVVYAFELYGQQVPFIKGDQVSLENWWKNVAEIPRQNLEQAKGKVMHIVADQLHSASDQLEKVQKLAGELVESAERMRLAIPASRDPNFSTEFVEWDVVAEKLTPTWDDIVAWMKAEFPPPDHAPSHEERAEMVKKVLGRLGEVLVHVCVSEFHVPENEAWHLWNSISTPLEALIVTIGDLIEQHPTIAEMLVVSLVSTVVLVVVPEAWLLSRILSLFGMGPLGPIKGTPAAWAQRYFFGAIIPKKSWFALLQSLAMKPAAKGFLAFLASLMGGLAVLGTCCGGRRG